MRERTRRDVLATIGIATAGGLAGCDGRSGGSDDVPAFVRWAPAPDELDLAAPYRAVGVAASDFASVDTPWTNRLASTFPAGGPLGSAFSPREVAHLQTLGQTAVFEGGLDGAAVRGAMGGSQFTAADPIAGYEVARATSGVNVASREDRVVMGRSRAEIAAIVRSREGDLPRLASAGDGAGTLIDRLPIATLNGARVHDPGVVGFSGALAEGLAIDVGAQETTGTGVVVFESGAADPEAVTEWAASADPIDRSAVETTTEGNTVVVSATVPTEGLTGMWQGLPEPAGPAGRARRTPQVSFEFDYASTGDGRGRLTVTHFGGDAVAVDRLFVEGSGFADVSDVDQTAAGQWQGTATDGSVSAGDNVTVGVSSDYEIAVRWEGEGDASTSLARDTGPDA